MRSIRNLLHLRPRLLITFFAMVAVLASAVLLPTLSAHAADDAEWGFIPRVISAEGEGVADVSVVVTDEAGEVVGEALTGENGSTETIPVDTEGAYVITFDTSAADQSFEGGDVHATVGTLGDSNTLPVQRVLMNLSTTANGGEIVLDEGASGSAAGSGHTITGNQVLKQIGSGLNLGLILAIAVIGMTMITGTTRLTNFAFGDSLTVGALMAFVGSAVWGLPIWAAGIIAIAAGAVLHFVMDMVLWRPARKRGVAIVPLMIASIGVGFIVRYLGYAFFGGNSRRVATETIPSFQIGQIVFPASTYFSAGIAILAIIAVSLWMQHSHSGRAIRAVSANRSLAAATGVDVDKTIRVVWVVSGGLAGLAGILMAFLNNVSWDMGFKALLLIFAAMILGGIGSVRGAVAGAIIVGVFTEVLVLWLPSDMKFVGALIVLIIMLLIRPQGLFGRAERIG